ncbi:nuclear GTPase SLIP-GC-like [Ciconia maguari]
MGSGWWTKPFHGGLWPLIRHVEVTFPVSDLVPEGVVFMDVPGTGNANSKRDEMWKESILDCSSIWIIIDVECIFGARVHEIMLQEAIKACQAGKCSNVTLVVTKMLSLLDREVLAGFRAPVQCVSLIPEEISGLGDHVRKLYLNMKRNLTQDYMKEILVVFSLVDVYTCIQHDMAQPLQQDGPDEYVKVKIHEVKKRISESLVWSIQSTLRLCYEGADHQDAGEGLFQHAQPHLSSVGPDKGCCQFSRRNAKKSRLCQNQ